MLKSKSATKLHKKAQVSPVFKYIFMLVVGAIILIFFLRFALRAESGGQEAIRVEVLHALDSSLQAFSISEYSSGQMPTPAWPQLVHMKFGTKANCGKFTIEGQKYFVPIERVLFGPEEMKTKQLQAWTLSWSFPFRVTNFFFLINPQRSKYYLIYDESNEKFLEFIRSPPQGSTKARSIEHFPSSFQVKYYHDSKKEAEPILMLKTADLVKVNYFTRLGGTCPSSIAQGLKGSCIKYADACADEELSSDELYKCYGEVEFYDGGTSTFIGREMMFGAIMAENYDVYKCQYDRALNELERFVNLYITKAEKLKLKRQACDEYQNFITLLRNMKDHIGVLKTSINYDDAEQLYRDADGIKNSNQYDLAGSEKCEMVF